MEMLTRADSELFRFVSEALLGLLKAEDIRRCGNKNFIAYAAIRHHALLTDDDDLAVMARIARR